MKIYILGLFLLTSVAPIYLNAQETNCELIADTITLNINELYDIDYRFKIIIDDYIKEMPFNQQQFKKSCFIYIIIYPHITYRASTRLIDSLYMENDFQKGIYSFPYDVYVENGMIANKKLLTISDFNSFYLYNYKGFEIIIASSLKLKFPWIGSLLDKQYYVSEIERFTDSYYSLYTLSDNEVVKRKYTKLYSLPTGVKLKRRYIIDKEKSDLLKE